MNTFTKTSTRNYFRRDESKLADFNSFEKALSKVECVLIEKNSKREIISINQLKELKQFWTIDCASYSSANSLIKEVKSSNTSALELMRTILGSKDSNTTHIDYLLCDQRANAVVDKIIRENFQVDSIKLIPEQRRLDLKWSIINEKKWEEILMIKDEYDYSFNVSSSRCYIQLEDIEMDKSINQIAIKTSSDLLILRNSKLNEYLVKIINVLSNKSTDDILILSKIVSLLNDLFYYKNLDRTNVETIIESKLDRDKRSDIGKLIWSRIDREELISTILETSFIKYDTTIWYRRDLY